MITFGGYQWRVLKERGDMALIMTEQIIGQLPYNDCAGEVTWRDCSLRKVLNHDFYNAFTAEEQSRIQWVVNRNADNPWYGSAGGGDTRDAIFLLSIEEAVCHYFGDSRKNLDNRSAKQRYWFQKKDANNCKRRATFQDCSWWWWLRSPGRDNKRAVYVHGDGNIGIQGNGTFRYSSKTVHPLTGDNCGGVRPALWLKSASCTVHK
ncbi:DUF6273 domain-containing protein [Fusibacter sp. JL298sf-3]